MIRISLTSIFVALCLSACLGPKQSAPVTYKGANADGATQAKAPTPAGLPYQRPEPTAPRPVQPQILSDVDELDMLDVEPNATNANPPPATLQTLSTTTESLSAEDELDMLDVDPNGLIPVDLRANITREPSPEVLGATHSGAIPAQAPTPHVEQQIVATRDRPATIQVQRGDTLFSLSEKYQVALQPLIERNSLQPPYALNAGQTLKLPPPLHYRVRKGDTLYSISRRYKIDFQSLAGINGLDEPYVISPDAILVLPSLATDEQGTWKANFPKTNVSKPGATAKPVSSTAPARKRAVVKPAANSTFIWPVDGKVLSSFGGKAGGMRNDGINIAANRGADIRAAGAGTVIYSGSELKNFGRLVLIRHDNGWVTAYAHNSEVKVREGAKVASGEVIALAGSSGSVDVPQLHFETRKGVKPVNPLAHLPKR